MSAEPLYVVVAFIQPFQLERVVDALRLRPNFPGLSVSEVRGFGRHAAHAPQRGERTEVDPFELRTRIEIYCRREELDGIVDSITTNARTGNPGDGKIFSSQIQSALRIRTGETDAAALLGGAVT